MFMAKSGTTPHKNRTRKSAQPGSEMPVPSCRLLMWLTSHGSDREGER